MLSQEVVEQEEEIIRQAVNKLSDDERRFYFKIVKHKIKDPDTYAVLNWFFVAGLHHFYLENWLKGAIDLVVFLIGIILIILEQGWIGLVMIVGVFIVELYALFQSQIIVQDYNNQVMRKALMEVRGLNL